ncbi:unnamed protein product [Orchesella dallaii]|uniref:Transcriptional adapter n=1 Tax=Orchesella dallaii TaxID=48710 RepID=A0ABP1RF10_9HEXA
MLFHEELFTRSQCTCCQQEITGVGIECVECHNGNLRLCCECFTLGAEVGQHKADHKYRFFDSGSLVLGFKPNNAKESSATQDAETEKSPIWSAREEIRLLDAIEQYGFGNWQDISKHIETKTPAEAKTEYVNRYVVGTLGELTWPSNIPNEVNRSICNSQIQKPVDHTVPCDDGPLSPSLTQRLPPLEITPDEMLQLVYMPNRDDYEKEYDNEAEKLVSQLSFTAEDEEVEIGLKLALVDMYARRLRERARRKRMIRDYQLVSKFFKKDKTRSNGSSLDPLGTKESFKGQFAAYEKNLQEKLRPFAQFHNSREFEHLIRNLVKEKEMKHRLTELYKYRSNGIRRLDDCSEFERIKGLAAAKKQSLETISENQEGRSGTKKVPSVENSAAPLLVRQLQQALPSSSPKAKSTTLSSIVNDVSVGASPSAARNLTPQQFSKDESNLKSFMELNELGHASLPQDLEDPKKAETRTQPYNESSSLLKEKLKASDDQFTVDIIPSADLLTDKELQLCMRTNIYPAQFLTIKTALLLARKPKTDNQPNVELKEIPCPPNIHTSDWEYMVTFFKKNYY